MAYKLRALPEARLELEREIAWLARYSEKAADKLLDDYEEKMGLIASGALSQDVSSNEVLRKLGYCKVLVGERHLALYYVEGDEIVVAGFFSQREDYCKLI